MGRSTFAGATCCSPRSGNGEKYICGCNVLFAEKDHAQPKSPTAARSMPLLRSGQPINSGRQMTIYTESQVLDLYDSSLSDAVSKLKQLTVCCGNDPAFGGLSGWVFEKTVHYCLRRELDARKLTHPLSEGERLKPFVRVDLGVGNVFIEIKQSGCWPQDFEKYGRYRLLAETAGKHFLLLTRREAVKKYREGITSQLGPENTFFLDEAGDWERLIERLQSLLHC